MAFGATPSDGTAVAALLWRRPSGRIEGRLLDLAAMDWLGPVQTIAEHSSAPPRVAFARGPDEFASLYRDDHGALQFVRFEAAPTLTPRVSRVDDVADAEPGRRPPYALAYSHSAQRWIVGLVSADATRVVLATLDAPDAGVWSQRDVAAADRRGTFADPDVLDDVAHRASLVAWTTRDAIGSGSLLVRAVSPQGAPLAPAREIAWETVVPPCASCAGGAVREPVMRPDPLDGGVLVLWEERGADRTSRLLVAGLDRDLARTWDAVVADASSNIVTPSVDCGAPDGPDAPASCLAVWGAQSQYGAETLAREIVVNLDPAVPDADGDGVRDQRDNCPLVANPGQADTDVDGRGDACDEDIDGDGLANAADCSPWDRAIKAAPVDLASSVRLPTRATITWQAQQDAERYNVYRGRRPAGLAWAYDQVCLDVDEPAAQSGDASLPLPGELFWYLVDGDNCFGEGSLGTASDGSTRPNGDLCVDADGDRAADNLDNCPQLANDDQANLDADDLGDACDPDDDGDGLPDLDEVARGTDPRAADTDGDGVDDGTEVLFWGSNPLSATSDGDGLADGFDNCPTIDNDSQADFDVDGVGDVCDNCPDRSNADQFNGDQDGLGDACERALGPVSAAAGVGSMKGATHMCTDVSFGEIVVTRSSSTSHEHGPAITAGFASATEPTP